MLCNSAHAVFINFDELDQASYLPADEDGWMTPLSSEYESQGLLFTDSAYLVTYGGWGIPLSEPNYVSGPGFSFEFIGDNLPVFISFNLGPSSGIAVGITVRGPNYFKSVTSSGAIIGMTDDPGTPYIPNEFFSFRSRTGISSVEIIGKAGSSMDNLTYTYANEVSVAEPSTLVLLMVGFLGLLGSRFKFIVKK